MALLGGVVTRPAGSSSYWPPVGTKVAWTATRPIEDLMAQDLKYPQFSNLGVIGNVAHLQKHGGHTPWRPGSVRGKVYAKDTACPPGFLAWLLKKCKSDYHTMWMRFFNCDNGQYDPAGNYLGYSADGHFHCEVANGHENTSVTLFDDFVRETGQGDIMNAAQEAKIDAILNMFVDGKSPTGTETHSGGKDRIWFFNHVDELFAASNKNVVDQVAALKSQVATIPEAVRAAVAAMEINMTEEQLAKFIDGVTERVNRPTSGTWTTNPEA